MEEEMSKRFIRVAVVLLLLLLTVVESERGSKRRAVEEYEGMTFPVNTGAVEESGRDAESEGKEWENTVLFNRGYSGIDAWMDFTNEVITEDGCFANIPQCIWGKWVVTEKWINAVYGWDANVEDEWIGMSMELRPDSFRFESQCDETVYWPNVMAVKDPWDDYYDYGIGKYWDLGIRGEYYFQFEFAYGYGPRELQEISARWCILSSDDEMIVFVPQHAAYKLEKAESYDVGKKDGSFEENGYNYDIYYGVWQAVKAVRTDETLDLNDCMETRLVLRDVEYKTLTWRVLGRSDETVDRFARMVGVGENNGYLICYNLYEKCFWDQMIQINDMTAILVKEGNLFWAIRTSDPVEDRIYSTPP